MSIHRRSCGNFRLVAICRCFMLVTLASVTWNAGVGKQGLAAESQSGEFPLSDARDVVDRAKNLAARLTPNADAGILAPLVADLETLDHRLADLSRKENVSDEDRREIFHQATSLKRWIAFANPLLNFDKLLFIKRHDAAGVFHMCDQYYGCNAVPGGGLYVLSDPMDALNQSCD